MSKSQKPKWNRTICEAIRKKAVIHFDYPRGPRTVEPQSHGISSAGNEVIRGVQISPRDRSGKSIEGKLYRISEMSELKETGATFSRPGPHFNPNDKAMTYVHCSLSQPKNQRRRASIKRRYAHAESIPYSEIKKKYPNEWVLVEFSKLGKDLHPKRGRVIAHAPNKEDIYKALLHTRGKNVSLEYFGPLPTDLAVMFCLVVTR